MINQKRLFNFFPWLMIKLSNYTLNQWTKNASMSCTNGKQDKLRH